jgi:hypothetical protein
MTKNTEKKSTASEAKLKDCFIITPIGGSGSDIFKKTNGLIRSVIRPVLNELGFEAIPAHEINEAGSITKQIIQHILNDELVICNLTGLNPNVMYELAIRHSFGKKVVIVAEDKTVLPFDISDQRTVFYEDSLIGCENVKPFLKKVIEAALTDDVKSNPVIDSIIERSTLDSNRNDPTEISNYLVERFDRLERFMTDNFYNKIFLLEHKLRSPIANIIGLVEILKENPKEAVAENGEIIRFLDKAVKRLDKAAYEISKSDFT